MLKMKLKNIQSEVARTAKQVSQRLESGKEKVGYKSDNHAMTFAIILKDSSGDDGSHGNYISNSHDRGEGSH